ncbi:hypothetical protein EG329_011937 [Mollisiaceae sp. DMI_Dod_QoI]|nr:hypothetical protein EG329_011937 [Helotiales sp. DMI_Dod_QoI]
MPVENGRKAESAPMTEFLNAKPHPSLETTENDKDEDKFIEALLSRTTRVGGPSSGLISWPDITIEEAKSQMKGIFHYVAEVISRHILEDQVLRRTINPFIGNSDPEYFETFVGPVFTTFIENLVFEVNGLLETAQRRKALKGSVYGVLGRLRYSGEEREEMRRFASFKARRISVGEMLRMIWQYRTPIWDEPKKDREGRNYWASNVEFVRGSKALQGLRDDLKKLRKSFVDIEAI